MGASFTWILKKKYDYRWKKYWLEKTDRATKTSLFHRNWAISLKPRRKSLPLRLVWWALATVTVKWRTAIKPLFLYFNLCSCVKFYSLSYSFTFISFLTNCICSSSTVRFTLILEVFFKQINSDVIIPNLHNQ
jgi:hypothetical protein